MDLFAHAHLCDNLSQVLPTPEIEKDPPPEIMRENVSEKGKIRTVNK